MKAPDALRTIGEVAADLDVAPHVLRFWEERFPAIRPVKRAGNRRYYRPADVALLRAIRELLHVERRTIEGVKKLIAEHGAAGVAAQWGGGEPPPSMPVTPELRAELLQIRTSLAAALA